MISSLPYSEGVQDTTEATLDADDTSLGTVCSVDPTSTFSNSVWYAYTPSTDEMVRIDTNGSSYGVAGAVVTGTPGAFSAVPGGCFPGGTTVALTAGTTYYIDLLQLGAGSGGTLHLSLQRGHQSHRGIDRRQIGPLLKDRHGDTHRNGDVFCGRVGFPECNADAIGRSDCDD